MSKSSSLQVQEVGDNSYPDFVPAQSMAVKSMATDFAVIIKRLQADGLLININGRKESVVLAQSASILAFLVKTVVGKPPVFFKNNLKTVHNK